MLSRRCHFRNDTIIPRLLSDHGPSAGPLDLIDLRNADNWFMKQKLATLSSSQPGRKTALDSDLAYTNDIGGSKEVRTALASLFRRHMNASVDLGKDDIVLGAGVSFILDALIEAICDPGDLVMIATPYWTGLDIPISIRNDAKVLPVSVPLDVFFAPESVKMYEMAFRNATASVRVVLICNPHNPLGGCYPEETLKALVDFCRDNNLHLISDEAYALSIHGGHSKNYSFVSSHTLQHLDFVHTVYGLGKDFGCNGIRMGALRTQNKAIRMSVALSTHSQVSSLTTRFCLDYVFRKDTMCYLLNENRTALRDNYLTTVKFLEWKNITFYPATAGFFVFAKLCGTDEKEYIRQLEEVGVASTSGTMYHFGVQGWFRICFAISPAMLDKVLKMIGLSLYIRRAAQDYSEKGTPHLLEGAECCHKGL